MAIKRKKKRNGQTARVRETVQEDAPVDDTVEAESDEETVEVTEASEDGDPHECDEMCAEHAHEHDEEKKSLLVRENLVRFELVRLTSFDYPSTSPGVLVFKLDNNQKYAVKEEDFLTWISSPVGRP